MELSELVGAVESEGSGRGSAVRFEPAAMANWERRLADPLSPKLQIIHAIRGANLCNVMTAAMIASTSWGAYQLMGENIYQPGPGAYLYPGSIARYLASPADQLASFDRFVTRHAIAFPVPVLWSDHAKLEEFCRVYNGPGDTADYAAKLRKIMAPLFFGKSE